MQYCNETDHAIALLLDVADEGGEVMQRVADDALVLRHGGADARELELLHAGRQRALRRAQPCGPSGGSSQRRSAGSGLFGESSEPAPVAYIL